MVCPSPTPARHRHGASWWWDSPGSRPARLGSRDQGRGFAIEQPSKIDRSAICHARGCARSEQKQLARDKQGRLSAEVFGRACATPAISPAATAGVTQRLGRVDVEGGGQSPDSLTRAGWRMESVRRRRPRPHRARIEDRGSFLHKRGGPKLKLRDAGRSDQQGLTLVFGLLPLRRASEPAARTATARQLPNLTPHQLCAFHLCCCRTSCSSLTLNRPTARRTALHPSPPAARRPAFRTLPRPALPAARARASRAPTKAQDKISGLTSARPIIPPSAADAANVMLLVEAADRSICLPC